MRLISSSVLLLTVLFVAGCGGGGEKGKNKDKDVPKSVEPK